MVKLAPKERCTGCGGCAAACNADQSGNLDGCIAMATDDLGFLLPLQRQDGCLDCGVCQRVCPVIDMSNEAASPDTAYAIAAYAAAVRDRELLVISSSGGVFGALARQVIGRGGVVFGAAFDDHFSLAHRTARTEDELEPLLCSKYVQSNAAAAMKAAVQAAATGQPVLFAGTICQINALSRILKSRDNVLLVDVVCHGVPSTTVWRKYIGELEKKHGGKLKSFTFRDKANGWQNYALRAEFEGGGVYRARPGDDPYMKLFLQNLSLRQSCYHCAAKERPASDLTLGDFWGIKRFAPDFDYQMGASLVMERTPAGHKALEEIGGGLFLRQVALQGLEQANPAILHSAPENPGREPFFQELDTSSLEALAAKYTKKPGLMDQVKGKVKNLLRK